MKIEKNLKICLMNLPHPENYILVYDVQILDYFQCHNVYKSHQIDIYTLVGHLIYLHVVLYLYLHEKLMIGLYYGASLRPVIKKLKQNIINNKVITSADNYNIFIVIVITQQTRKKNMYFIQQ